MTTRTQLFLLLTLAVLVVFAAVIGIIGFALARWDGATIPASITRGGIVFAGTLALGIALISAILPALA